MKALIFIASAPFLLLASCSRDDHAAELPSADEPGNYRPLRAGEIRDGAVFTAGLTVKVPRNAKLSYPQGIDSRLMSLEGPGYTLNFDDYGGFNGAGTIQVAGAPAQLEERTGPGCRMRVWRVRLPASTPTVLRCSSPNSASDCVRAPAQATIASFCTSEASCRQVDEVVASLRFEPRPWPTVPLPDPDWRPEEPACRVE